MCCSATKVYHCWCLNVSAPAIPTTIYHSPLLLGPTAGRIELNTCYIPVSASASSHNNPQSQSVCISVSHPRRSLPLARQPTSPFARTNTRCSLLVYASLYLISRSINTALITPTSCATLSLQWPSPRLRLPTQCPRVSPRPSLHRPLPQLVARQTTRATSRSRLSTLPAAPSTR